MYLHEKKKKKKKKKKNTQNAKFDSLQVSYFSDFEESFSVIIWFRNDAVTRQFLAWVWRNSQASVFIWIFTSDFL